LLPRCLDGVFLRQKGPQRELEVERKGMHAKSTTKRTDTNTARQRSKTRKQDKEARQGSKTRKQEWE